jgi:ABC-2 family transporter protein
MMWVAWRQHRAESLLTLGVLVMLALFLIITGLNMAHAFQQLGLSDCLRGGHRDCSALEDAFQSQFRALSGAVIWLNLCPALLGILVGAPLIAREVEQNTHRLAWTQSITRFRWLAVKLSIVLGTSLLASGALMALLIWWYGPLNQVQARFAPSAFDFQGPVLIGTTLLALTVGITASALARRTVLAMLLTLVFFLAIRLPIELWLRPHYEPPIVATWALDASGPNVDSADDWIISNGWIDAQGNQTTNLSCSSIQNLQQCIQALGYRSNYMVYQPSERFWTFQWIETGIYLAFSALALALTSWLVRRRLS